MWPTKDVDKPHIAISTRLRDVICSQFASCCCSHKPPLRRSTDALVTTPTPCVTLASSTCASRWRCKWLKIVCTKGFLIIVNLVFLVRTCIHTTCPENTHWVFVIRLCTKFEVRIGIPVRKIWRTSGLSISRPSDLDLWPLTLKLVRIIARGVDNLPTNFGVSRMFRSRLIGQHVSDASRDLATLTFALLTSK